MEKEKLLGNLFACITITIWGTTFIASKILLTTLNPLELLTLRCMIAYLFLCIIGHKTLSLPKSLKEETVFLFLAVFGIVFYFLLENTALTLTSASNVSIILSAAPILTALFAHFITKNEKLTKFTWLGFAIAIIGVIFVVLNGKFVLNLNPVGDLLSLLAAVSWAIYSVRLKSVNGRYDHVTLTRKVLFYSLAVNGIMMISQGYSLHLSEVFHTPQFIFCIFFLGLLGSGMGFIMWSYAVHALGVVRTNNYIYLSPFITMVCAAIVLNEQITLIGILGAVLIFFGVFISDKK